VTRVEKNSDFTVISNDLFKERNMSLKAKGLLALMLSLPDNWDYSINGLVGLSTDGKDSVMKALSELERFGYLKRQRKTDEKGHFAGYNYDVYEQPQSNVPCAEKPCSENLLQLTTKYINDEKINISSKSDDVKDDHISLTEDKYSESTENEARVITLSVKEAAEEVYKPYPRKEGKAKGFEEILAYLKKGRNLAGLGTVRFNHEQLYCAVRDYAMDCSEKTRKNSIYSFSALL